MTTEQYLTFQKFTDKASALELADLLKQNYIDCKFEDTSGRVDLTFSNSEAIKEYRVKLRKENFEAANNLLLQLTAQQLENVSKEYYLYEFSDEELTEIIHKPDEWCKLDYLLAQKLLKDRGREITPELAETYKKQRIQELSEPERSQKGWIIAGYIFSFLGGLLGVFIGWHLRYHKKTLPNGDRVFAYSIPDRKNGYNIFIIGIISFVCWLIVRILSGPYLW
ncbi:MAG TPA: hypothetical protein PKN48_03505 [Bacteroidales bacterium]|nr:hypothetical protein [Bacteroidales bacterium]